MTQQQQTELKDNLKRRNTKMAKININGTDVYTDDFNEEQEKVFVEIQQLDSEIRRSEYLVAIMKIGRVTLPNNFYHKKKWQR